MLRAKRQSAAEPPALDEIVAFLRVAETSSFTAAARRLALPKSTVSRQVSRLEEKLGTQLLVRTTRRLSLTEAGTAYVELAGRAIANLDEATQQVREQGRTPRGHLRVTAPHDVGNTYLAGLVAEFCCKHPQVTVEVLLEERVLDLVAEQIDVAIRATRNRPPDSSLVARRVGSDTLGFFASPRYLGHRGTPKTLEDLERHQCIVLRAVRGYGTWQVQGTEGPREVRVRASVSANDFAFVKSAAIEHAGVALLPRLMVEQELKARRLRRVLADYSTETSGIWVVTPGNRLMAPKVSAFRELVIERFSKLSPQE